jgi:aspartate-semialdehyde dehydrogenase
VSSWRAALVHPATLLGRELLDTLRREPGPWQDLRLLATSEEEVGSVTDGLHGATFVGRAAADELEDRDVVFFCGPIGANRSLLAELPPRPLAVVLSTDAELADGEPRVAGCGRGGSGRVVLSPHPAVVALAHLLAPLREHGLAEAIATVVQPASLFEEPALEEMFEQTKALLTFSAKPEPRVFPQQIAFNLLPASGEVDTTEMLREVLAGGASGSPPRLAVQVLQGGIFHGVAISLHVRLARDPGVEGLRETLTASGTVASVDPEDRGTLGPIDTPGRDEVLLGEVRAAGGRPGCYWIWAVADNLTQGGVLNALALARQALAG